MKPEEIEPILKTDDIIQMQTPTLIHNKMMTIKKNVNKSNHEQAATRADTYNGSLMNKMMGKKVPKHVISKSDQRQSSTPQNITTITSETKEQRNEDVSTINDKSMMASENGDVGEKHD